MKIPHLLALIAIFVNLVWSQNLEAVLNQLGLNEFSTFMRLYNPSLVDHIGNRIDITVWAPGNEAVARYIAAQRKRGPNDGASVAGSVSHSGTPPKKGNVPGPTKKSGSGKTKRQIVGGSAGFQDTNFEPLLTFLNDSTFANLGPDNAVRFVRNYAAPLDALIDTNSMIEITTGMGNQRYTLRGPFKFNNGVIYEVNDFFTLPQPLTATIEQVNIAQKFFKTVRASGQFSFYEDTPAVTIFAPIDSTNLTAPGNEALNSDPGSHILADYLYYSPMLEPDTTILASSGASIKISMSGNGDILVNCRRIVKPDVVTKNGVVHFIEGPLYGGCSPPSPPPSAPTAVGAASTYRYDRIASALIVAVGVVVSLYAF